MFTSDSTGIYISGAQLVVKSNVNHLLDKIGCICKSFHNQIGKQIILLFCHKQLCLRQAAGVLKAEYDVCRQLKMIDNIYQFTYICNLR